MKLYIRQKVFSWRDKTAITDERGNPVFYAQSEIWSVGRKIHLFDARGQEVAFISQKVLSFLPRYDIWIGGQQVAQIVREFSLFKPRYRVDGIPWHIDGDFWAHEYSMNDGQRQIMALSKHWFTWGDSYEMIVPNPQEVLLSLCVALALDAALDSVRTNDSVVVNNMMMDM
ncbi:MAG: LURP-one-related family protein [Propionibacteriaceae bacterium]|jgi:uncharacterized protein YxjI|nr:LURP-one-related family protein [Propionibacteriaceae bacterium]